MEPINSTGSCGMMDILERKSCNPIVDISMPSMKTLPEIGSTSRNNADTIDVFPRTVKSIRSTDFNYLNTSRFKYITITAIVLSVDWYLRTFSVLTLVPELIDTWVLVLTLSSTLQTRLFLMNLHLTIVHIVIHFLQPLFMFSALPTLLFIPVFCWSQQIAEEEAMMSTSI
jgi:hypothetical protein